MIRTIIAAESAKEFLKRSIPNAGLIAKAAGLDSTNEGTWKRRILPKHDSDFWRLTVRALSPQAESVSVSVRGTQGYTPRLWFKQVPVANLEAELARLVSWVEHEASPEKAGWLDAQGYR